ncbi:MAG: DNA polymerase-3 subunit epsilon [Sphingobacteriales bacterium]|jgi:DNA polymerase-3 subunit epsilon
MQLKLKRPLCLYDIESTGVNVSSDRIVEISILKVHPDGKEETKTIKINPTIPIPPEVSMIHGIYDEDIKDAPIFKEVANDLVKFIGNSDLSGYNCLRFDVPILMEEFLRAGIDFDLEKRFIVDVQNIFHQMEQRTLKAAYKFYCNKSLENAHTAEADTIATYEVLKAQIEKYEKTAFVDKDGKESFPVKNDMEQLHTFTNVRKFVDFAGRLAFNKDGKEVINFGKHKGKIAEEVFQYDAGYYDWMMKGDFPEYTKKKITEIRLRGFNKK